MNYKYDDFEVVYCESDMEYIDNFCSYFIQNKELILNFFGLNRLSKELKIVFYDDIEKYSEIRNNNISETSVGNMDFDDNYYYINILSYKEFVKRKGHEKNNLDYLFKTILHEFVHICHEEIGTYSDSFIWLREGVAIVLSKQYDGLDYKIDNCTIDDLLNNKRTWYINYYSLVKYVFDKYGSDYVKKLIRSIDFQKSEMHKLYNELLEVLECTN